ncbi:MAG: hypothetical protein ACJAU3_001929 [Zhongshania sp.]
MVYRNRADSVQFLEINAVTARLLALLAGDAAQDGRAVLLAIAAELGLDSESVLSFGRDILAQLVSLDILIIAEP